MNEITLPTTSIKHLTFKGKFKGSRPNYIPKAISKRFTITDGFYNRFKTTITVYIPKLNSRYPKLQTMLHIVNGGGSCQLRVRDPRDLADRLEEIVGILRSEPWLDKAFRVEDIAQHIMETGELPVSFDEEIVDVNEWKDSLINDVDVSSRDLEDLGKEFLRQKGICEDPR